MSILNHRQRDLASVNDVRPTIARTVSGPTRLTDHVRKNRLMMRSRQPESEAVPHAECSILILSDGIPNLRAVAASNLPYDSHHVKIRLEYLVLAPSLNPTGNPLIQCKAESINEARPAIFSIEPLYLVHLIREIHTDLPEDETLSCLWWP